MKTIKVSEVIGVQLDWLVADALKLTPTRVHGRGAVRAMGYANKTAHGYQYYVLRSTYQEIADRCEGAPFGISVHIWSPSTDWAQGGPIIDLEKIEIVPSIDGKVWYAESLDRKARVERQPTPLIAAMRCFVVSKLGDEVEVPEELT